MTTVMSGKTQLEFQLPPGSNAVHRFHGNVQRYPGNLQPTGRDGRPFALQKQNQLAFNVNMAAAADSLTKRYRKPSAVVVEKLGTSPARGNERSAASIGQISFLSQEKLSQALFLAKRDNAKRRRNGQVINMADVATIDSGESNSDVARERKVERTRTQQESDNEVIQGRKSSRTARKQESDNSPESPRRVKIKERHQDVPTSPGLVLRLAGDSPEALPGDKQSRQVWKLRRELHRYMRELEGHLRQGQVPSPSKRKRRGSVEKISDTEDDPRTEVRRQEQLTRAGRMVYTLQHQIAEVEQDLNRPASERAKQARKAQVLKKLGAAHRAAVKVLQVFIQQLPDQYSGGGGLPQVYQDLGHVIKQLSQLSAQLQVGSSEDMSAEGLLHLLGRTQPKPRIDRPAEVTAHKRAPEGRSKVKTRRGQPVWKDRPAQTAYPGPKLHPDRRLEDDVEGGSLFQPMFHNPCPAGVFHTIYFLNLIS
ncbi:protein moonraker-like [Branchiostoma lanceolatum]|uniref:protein moonraker-like n=1 Tax=Branchiostoma lanceolatum TaxID=7740 RepID=UPI0034552E98